MMIFVVELPAAADPRAWFAFDDEDLLRKVAATDIEGLRMTHAALGDCEAAALAEATLCARGDCRIYWNEAQAMAAFERRDDLAWQGSGWRAHRALREQLLALEILADDC
jgi:hypothetical protein